MPFTITVTQLELAINTCQRNDPPLRGVLTPDLRAMAELYGWMIFVRASSIDLDQQPRHLKDVVMRWVEAARPRVETEPGPVESATFQKAALCGSDGPSLPACAYRPDDPAFDDCEACQ